MIQLPAKLLPAKPRFKEPCNRCGLCCSLEICPAGKIAYPDAVAPCPLLKIEDGKATCQLVEVEIKHNLEPVIQRALGIGEGCTMEDT